MPSRKLCDSCDTKPVFGDKTDFLDTLRLLVLQKLSKTRMRPKIPAYEALGKKLSVSGIKPGHYRHPSLDLRETGYDPKAGRVFCVALLN
jgi:hypothetical protein